MLCLKTLKQYSGFHNMKMQFNSINLPPGFDAVGGFIPSSLGVPVISMSESLSSFIISSNGHISGIKIKVLIFSIYSCLHVATDIIYVQQ